MKPEGYKKRVFRLLDKVSHISGDIVEVGTYDGDTSKIICEHIIYRNLNKKFYGFDTFSGYLAEDMTGSNKESQWNFHNRRWDTEKEIVENRLAFFGKERYCLFEGDCKITIPQAIRGGEIQKLSLIYIDCNLYPPSKKAIMDLYPLLEIGGIVAIDEHLVGGETKAIKEAAKKLGQDLEFFSEQAGPSFYFIKG